MKKRWLLLVCVMLFSSALVILSSCKKEDKMIWFEHSFTKVLHDSKYSGKDTYKIYMAKNEYESCQYVIKLEQPEFDLRLELSPFTNKDGDTVEAVILEEYYLEVSSYLDAGSDYVDYPDPVVPIGEDYRFDAQADCAVPFMIRLHTTADTPAGDYSSTIKVISGEEVLFENKITAHVWDFAYSDSKACATAAGISYGDIKTKHNIETNEEWDAMYIKYYEFLLDYGISAYDLPYNILSAEADKYMSDPRVTSFKVPHSSDDATIVAYYEKLKTNPEWMDKAYFYPLDEPTSPDMYYQLEGKILRLDRLFPGNQVCVPFFVDPIMFEETDAVEYMKDLIDIWCPKAYCFEDKNIYFDLSTREDISKSYYDMGYDPFAKRMVENRKNGDKVWWYVCWEPGEPYANLFVDMAGINHRILFWQQKKYDVDGFLYWQVNHWGSVNDPWTDMSTVKWINDFVYGDGSLLYNGNKVGIDGPVASLRLEAVRDGIEDFELLTMAEAKLGEKAVDKIISKCVTSVSKYTKDGDKLVKYRIQLGNELEKAMK